KIEARLKLPSGQGMWPAFWMLPTDWVYGGWAASGEIDVMEAVNIPKQIVGSIHYGGVYPDNASSNGYYSQGHGPKAVDFSKDFHVYTLEWTANQMKWYVDGNLYSTKTTWWSSGGPFPAPFDQRFHILLNLAVGGNWPGAPDATTVFPQKYYIDWVRVYQFPNNAPTVTITNPQESANLPAGTISIAANAADSDGSITTVKFYKGTTYLGEDTTAPYSFDWTNATDGCYKIKVVAVDNGGLQAADEVNMTVGIGCPQLPYSGTPAAIPGTIQAEDFDTGIEGEAYHDITTGNSGGVYRPDSDVDIEACTEGGYNVGWIDAAEWLEYTVNIASADNYDINIRVASQSTEGNFHLEMNGVSITGSVSAPATGGWQNWQTVTVNNISLSAGIKIMKFVSETGGFNLNYISLSKSSGVPTTMHVASIIESTVAGSAGKKFGQATVMIQDNFGNPVPSATVTGSFSGDFNETVAGSTGADGTVALTTSVEARRPVFSFCVSNVTHTVLTYDQNSNTITCTPLAKVAGDTDNLNIPSEFLLEQNYPNPFNPSTQITYQIPVSGQVNLAVYDVLGKQIMVLVDEFQETGIHSIQINAETLSSGIYFYKLQIGDFMGIRKMVLTQ
ncbi:MAG: glycosyl hydrolase family protein, partial [Calditrichaeota bacterium]